MSYCTGKYIEKARGEAMKMLLIEEKPLNVVANHFGVNRSTIWRWKQKWLNLNQHIELENPIRRKYLGISPYKWKLYGFYAHIERLNHTLQEECTGKYSPCQNVT